jgi:hypothetical protein
MLERPENRKNPKSGRIREVGLGFTSRTNRNRGDASPIVAQEYVPIHANAVAFLGRGSKQI